jgi:hypothetical protein
MDSSSTDYNARGSYKGFKHSLNENEGANFTWHAELGLRKCPRHDDPKPLVCFDNLHNDKRPRTISQKEFHPVTCDMVRAGSDTTERKLYNADLETQSQARQASAADNPTLPRNPLVLLRGVGDHFHQSEREILSSPSTANTVVRAQKLGVLIEHDIREDSGTDAEESTSRYFDNAPSVSSSNQPIKRADTIDSGYHSCADTINSNALVPVSNANFCVPCTSEPAEFRHGDVSDKSDDGSDGHDAPDAETPTVRMAISDVGHPIFVDMDCLAVDDQECQYTTEQDGTSYSSSSSDGSRWFSEFSESATELEESHPLFKYRVSLVAFSLYCFRSWCSYTAHGTTDDSQTAQSGGGTTSKPKPSSSGSVEPTGGRKRTASGRKPAGDEDNSDDESGQKKRRKGGSGGGGGPGLACPFYKKDRDKYWRCAGRTMNRVQDVKQHLHRKHRVPTFCPYCKDTFTDQEKLTQHAEAGPCPLRRVPAPDGISDKQFNLLNKRARNGSTDELRWYSIWDILFPGHPRPQSIHDIAELSQNLSNYTNFMLEYGPAIIRRHVAGFLQPASAYLISDLEAELESAIRRGVMELARHYTGHNSTVHPPTVDDTCVWPSVGLPTTSSEGLSLSAFGAPPSIESGPRPEYSLSSPSSGGLGPGVRGALDFIYPGPSHRSSQTEYPRNGSMAPISEEPTEQPTMYGNQRGVLLPTTRNSETHMMNEGMQAPLQDYSSYHFSFQGSLSDDFEAPQY